MIRVKKASGEIEPFSEEKVRRSLRRSGASKKVRDEIINHIKKELYDGISTKEIYSHIYELLEKKRPYLVGRYDLKRSLMELGPSGHPFEKFIGALFSHYGYSTETGVIISGQCVKHEVDVVARKEAKHFMVECKFHNRPGIKTDVKVALYVKARFDDITARWKDSQEHQSDFHQAWLVTNTKLTSDAIQYGRCVGMKLIAWGYPTDGSLQKLIEEARLYPITCLRSLSHGQKRNLLENGIVVCRYLKDLKKTDMIASLGLTEKKLQDLYSEIAALCG